MRGVPIARDAAPLNIVLEPGRDVRVSVLDARGGAVAAGSLTAWVPDEERGWASLQEDGGARLLRDLPARELELRLQLAGKEFREPLGAGVEALELRVPTLGRLEVDCAPAFALPERARVRLRSLDEEGLAQSQPLPAADSAPALFEAVLPGSYELSYTTWTLEGRALEITGLGTPVQVQVEPAETVHVRLR